MSSKLELIYKVDQAIENTCADYRDIGEAFAVFSKSILNLIPDASKIYLEEGSAGIISDYVKPEFRRLISWSILRFIGHFGQFPADPPNLRPKIINYLKNEIKNEICKEHLIDFTQQSYELESSLSKITPKIELDFFESAAFTNLDDMHIFCNYTQKSLNKSQNSGLLFVFMNKKVVNSGLNRVCTSVNSFYKSKEVPDMITLDNFNDAMEACDNFIEELSIIPVKYAKHLETQIRNIKAAINHEMKNLKLSEPAVLSVQIEPKKYPLHIEGKIIKIKIQVNNTGPGNAFNCLVELIALDELTLTLDNMFIGNIQTKQKRNIYVESVIKSKAEKVLIEAHISWINFDRSENKEKYVLEIQGQDPSIDWKALDLKQPYSLDAATGENFFGREKLIRNMLSIFCKKNPESAFLWGQKRVGKTSVAKVIGEELIEKDSNISVAYMETIRDVTAQDTINRICKKLIDLLKSNDQALRQIPEPTLTGTLAPLADFLEIAISIVPDKKFIIILDEFDELPIELYKARGIADAFFQTLGKGIAAKRNVGVLLVGGERIPVIMREQGMRLNMYKSTQIDYFNRDDEWEAFIELVRQPGKPIEFSMEAIQQLWNFTAGNPFFLNLIASRIAQMMIERRDAHVTVDEVNEGKRYTLNEVDVNSFAHFWQDGLTTVDDNDYIEQRSERVRFLLSFADAQRSNNLNVSKEVIMEYSRNYRCTSQDIERQLRSFLDRKIFFKDDENIYCRVNMFQEWLKESGYLALTGLVATELYLAEKYEKELLEEISSLCIRELIEKWGYYQGKPKSEDEIRAWLKQFNSNEDRILMFKLLQNLKFYTNGTIRMKFEDIHKYVVRSIVTKIKEGQKKVVKTKRRDIIVTYLGLPGSSGPTMQRLYRQANNIIRNCCVSPEKLKNYIEENNSVAAVVFTDDFIGTGKTACGLLKALIDKDPELPSLVMHKGIKIWYVSIVGTAYGLIKVEKILEEIFPNLSQVIAVDELDDKDKAFAMDSGMWETEAERLEAKEIAESFGKRLEPRAPLGFGDTQALLVFEDNCPNNSLPILYKKSKKYSTFEPLFPRS